VQGTEQGRKEGCAVGEEERGGPAQRGREEGEEGEQHRSGRGGIKQELDAAIAAITEEARRYGRN